MLQRRPRLRLSLVVRIWRSQGCLTRARSRALAAHFNAVRALGQNTQRDPAPARMPGRDSAARPRTCFARGERTLTTIARLRAAPRTRPRECPERTHHAAMVLTKDAGSDSHNPQAPTTLHKRPSAEAFGVGRARIHVRLVTTSSHQRPQSGREPSASVKPYSRRGPRRRARGLQRATWGRRRGRRRRGRRRAASRRARSAVPRAASRQFASVTPKWSSIASERRKPGVTASAVMPCSVSSSACASARRIDRRLDQVVEERPAVVVASPSVTSTTRPPGHEQQGEPVLAGDQVGLDGAFATARRPVLEVELPERLAPLDERRRRPRCR